MNTEKLSTTATPQASPQQSQEAKLSGDIWALRHSSPSEHEQPELRLTR